MGASLLSSVARRGAALTWALILIASSSTETTCRLASDRKVLDALTIGHMSNWFWTEAIACFWSWCRDGRAWWDGEISLNPKGR